MTAPDHRSRDPPSRPEETSSARPLTAREAADRAGVNERTIRRAIGRGDLAASKHGGAFQIAPLDLDQYLRRRRRFRASGRNVTDPVPGLDPAARRIRLVPLIARRQEPLSSLPRPLTQLVGRDSEAAELGALLRRPDPRLVTLIGPGGIGKTRLAIRVAAEVAAEFAGGVSFVSLAPVDVPELVGPAIARVVSDREPGGEFSLDRLRRSLGDHAVLLVLDNFEHLMPAATMIAGLLAAAPQVRLLVTSRAALGLSGEQAYLVPPLSLPDSDDHGSPSLEGRDRAESDAVRLFVQPAQAARSSFALTRDNAPAVRAICRRLDGLPLAIELAAARVNHLSPAALLDRMTKPGSSRLALLTGERPDQPARFQTMSDAIAWSNDLLAAAEQARFRELAVFTGGFSLAAAAAGCELDEPSTLEQIRGLAAKSLLRDDGDQTPEPRYGMLETIREFGLARLAASGQDAPVRQRHAEWCLAFAEETGRLEDATAGWLDRLDQEHANLRAALAWLRAQRAGASLIRLATALSAFWEQRGHFVEGSTWLETAIALSPDPSPARLKGLAGAGTMAWFQSDFARASHWHGEALRLARRLGDRDAEAFALNNLGVQALEQSDFDVAVTHFEAAPAIAGRDGAGPSRATMFALHNLGQVSRMRLESAAAAGYMERALALGRALGEDWIMARALNGLGLTALDRGDPARATVLHREALELGRAFGNLADIVDSIEGLARVRAATGGATAAAHLFGTAEALRARIDVPLAPLEQTYYEPSLQQIQVALGDEALATAWTAGRRLSIDTAIAEALTVAPPAASPALGLTEREREILRLLASGSTNRELGQQLFISPATAARHVANIFNKLGVDSRAKATAYARRHGIG